MIANNKIITSKYARWQEGETGLLFLF